MVSPGRASTSWNCLRMRNSGMITRIVGNTWLTRTQPIVMGRKMVRNLARPYADGRATSTVRMVEATATSRLLRPASIRLALSTAAEKLLSVGDDGIRLVAPSAISRVLLNAVESSHTSGKPRNAT
jgi:hypothetical protein